MGIRKITNVGTIANLMAADPSLKTMLLKFGHTPKDIIRAARSGKLTSLKGVGDKRAPKIMEVVRAAGYLHEESAQSLAMRKFLTRIDKDYCEQYLSDAEYEQRKAFTPEQIRRALNLLAGLDRREKEILTLRFGLDGNEAQSREGCGAVFGVSSDQIRQIEATALRKLRQPAQKSKWAEIFPEILEMPTQTTAPTQSGVPKQAATAAKKTSTAPAKETSVTQMKHPMYVSDGTHISRLGFSIRAYNCLRRARISDVCGLRGLTRQKLSEIRDMKPDCEAEILRKLDELGIIIPD